MWKPILAFINYLLELFIFVLESLLLTRVGTDDSNEKEKTDDILVPLSTAEKFALKENFREIVGKAQQRSKPKF